MYTALGGASVSLSPAMAIFAGSIVESHVVGSSGRRRRRRRRRYRPRRIVTEGVVQRSESLLRIAFTDGI